MRQVIQYQKTGELSIEELPTPTLQAGGVLVQNYFSLVSAGTERSSVETAQASLLGKAKKRPDLVKQVKDNIRREGLLATWHKVKVRMDNYAQLGYSSAGIVLESSVPEFTPGDRVACAGQGYASHAEVVFVPKNLVARIPDSVDFDEAAFTTLGAIALQGIRQADVRMGENVAVIGLGLVGLLAIQLLKANGCRVIGLDISDAHFDRALKLGCDVCFFSSHASLPMIESFTRGYGADAVLITAASKSSQPVELAIEMARKRAAVVVVGSVAMNIPRFPFYQKEIQFRISCSYGPGRYDSDYEESGHDYPVGYVRWTENRNMQAVLDLLAMRKLDVKSLITHRFKINDALQAYDLITGKIKEPYLGLLIQYPSTVQNAVTKLRVAEPATGKKLKIGFIGAGNFAQSSLLPPLKECDVILKNVMTASPVHAKSVAQKFGFEFCAGTTDEVLTDIDVLFIATRHDSHAEYVKDGLRAGCHVFVEKPLAVKPYDLNDIYDVYTKAAAPLGQRLFVGFNRRYAKPFADIKSFLADVREPLIITYRVNAGFIPKDHWTQQPDQGGRIIGECCHFFDCMAFLTDSKPVSVYAESITSDNTQVTDADNVSVVVKFANGSVGTLIYVANGENMLAKEYCEISGGGKSAVLHNFSRVAFYANRKKREKKYSGDKGHADEVKAFIRTLQGAGEKIIPFDSLVDTTLLTFKTIESLKLKKPMSVTL
ncbi:oxidoreductase [candidate division KSB1 bacterium]|nr:bi-domain-containing oxidoreductase [candidate division KSB1 bacterium]RQW04157.1 MAG: oxidoreductase [candidate division KSB1 bacterium]